MTIVNAYNQLLAEGYLASCVGSGTFVRGELPDDHKMSQFSCADFDEKIPRSEESAPQIAMVGLSSRGQRMATIEEGIRPSYVDQPALFSLGIPALDEFPLDI